MKEIELNNDAEIDQHLLEALVQAPEGHCKNASDMTSQVVRRRLRETGFRRLVLPDKPISDSELVMLPDTELPVVVAISFNDTADTAFYRGDKFGGAFNIYPDCYWHDRYVTTGGIELFSYAFGLRFLLRIFETEGTKRTAASNAGKSR
jgi:hypothetical protein